MSVVLPVPDLNPTAPARRFGFLGRVSTEDNQDPEASYNWQKSRDTQALIVGCDARLTRYQAALDAGADPKAVAEWTRQVQAEHAAVLARAAGRDHHKPCPCRKPHPCSSCRMLVLMKHSTEPVASSYIKAGDLARGHERHGQWLERTGVGDALMRPVPVVELLELPQGVQKVGLVPDQRAVQ